MVRSHFWMVLGARSISSAMARIEPPASWASRTASRISLAAESMCRMAVCSRRRCGSGISEGFLPGLDTVGIVSESATHYVSVSDTI